MSEKKTEGGDEPPSSQGPLSFGVPGLPPCSKCGGPTTPVRDTTGQVISGVGLCLKCNLRTTKGAK